MVILGRGRCLRMEDVLTPSEMSIVTSYWSTKLQETRNFKINPYQKKAIDLAWGCTFSMIQGPPGVY